MTTVAPQDQIEMRWGEDGGLTLTLEGDRIRASRKLYDDERDFILAHRDEIIAEIPKMSRRTKADDLPSLRAWYEKSISEAGERARLRMKHRYIQQNRQSRFV